MNTSDFSTVIQVDQSPSAVFNALTNVRGWWSEEIEGDSAKLNDEFNYHYEDIHRCKVRLTEVIPNRKIVWLVEQNYLSLPKTKPNGRVQNQLLKYRRKTEKQNLNFRILVWFRNMNVLTSAGIRGPITFRTV